MKYRKDSIKYPLVCERALEGKIAVKFETTSKFSTHPQDAGEEKHKGNTIEHIQVHPIKHAKATLLKNPR